MKQKMTNQNIRYVDPRIFNFLENNIFMYVIIMKRFNRFSSLCDRFPWPWKIKAAYNEFNSKQLNACFVYLKNNLDEEYFLF
jgi:hypothetical protein